VDGVVDDDGVGLRSDRSDDGEIYTASILPL